MARVVPQSLLKNRAIMDVLAACCLPMVRLVDSFMDSQNGIRVDVTKGAGATFMGLLCHQDLEKAVGDAIAAFVVQSLGNVPPEVHFPDFPEEIDCLIYMDGVLHMSSRGAVEYFVRAN